MSGSSFPQRVVWSRAIPGFSPWSGLVGMLLSGISLLLTGATDLSWWTKAGLVLISLAVPIIAYAIWKYVSIAWQRLRQYDLLYDKLVSTDTTNRQWQENFIALLQTLTTAGIQIFEVTGIEWGNRSPLLVIACDHQLPSGSKLVVIDITTLDTLGRFEIDHPTIGGYLMRENRIENPVWWGFLREQIARYAHPPVRNTIAILLP